MQTQWLKGVPKEEKEGFKNKLNASKDLFTQQRKILLEMLEAEYAVDIGEEDFSSPNYSELKAYRRGKMKSYKEIISLLEGLTLD